MKLKHYKQYVQQFWRGVPAADITGEVYDVRDVVHETNDGQFLRHDPRALFTMTLGLMSEAGEAGDCVKKLVRGNGFDLDALQLELGDVLYYLVMLHHEFGLDIADTMAKNVAKLEARSGR